MIIKVVSLKKIVLVVIFTLIITLVFFGILSGAKLSNRNDQKNISIATIAIDAGHGGTDGGAVGASKETVEKVLNLSVSKKLAELLKKSNYNVLLTRHEDDIVIEYPKGSSAKQKKRIDLLHRKQFAKDNNADLLLTIHMNTYTDSSIKGAQVFYDSDFEISQKIAQQMQQELKGNLDKENNRVAKPAEKTILLFKDVSVPTVLVECGFISNYDEEKLLKDGKYQDKIAKSLCDAIKKIEFE